jgi:recombinational DNA repair protein RecR
VYEGAVQDLIDELGRLPGVGPKSAQRIAFHLLQAETVDAQRLADAITRVKATVRFCGRCWNISEAEECRICRDPRRDPAVLCVVEEARDVVAIERTREYRGRYHVLGGAISPDRRDRARGAAHHRAAATARRRGGRPRSSSRPTPTSRARRPRRTCPGCCSRSGCG